MAWVSIGCVELTGNCSKPINLLTFSYGPPAICVFPGVSRFASASCPVKGLVQWLPSKPCALLLVGPPSERPSHGKAKVGSQSHVLPFSTPLPVKNPACLWWTETLGVFGDCFSHTPGFCQTGGGGSPCGFPSNHPQKDNSKRQVPSTHIQCCPRSSLDLAGTRPHHDALLGVLSFQVLESCWEKRPTQLFYSPVRGLGIGGLQNVFVRVCKGSCKGLANFSSLLASIQGLNARDP